MAKRRILQGFVVSDKMDKTITVEVRNLSPHPFYGKVVRRRTRVKAHDANNSAHLGDQVKIVESRPFSHLKRWALVEVVRKAVGSEERTQDDSAQ